MNEIYLDNSATTAVAEPVAALMTEVMTGAYGNPSSLHKKGIEAEKYIIQTKETLSGILECREKEIVFTSGGTESDNWALFSAASAMKRKGNRVIVSSIEHPAVLEPAKELERQGFDVVFIPVDDKGLIDRNAFEAALSSDTILVSVMMVNNEVGSRQPVEWIAGRIKEKCPDAVFHVDGVQAFGRYRIVPSHMGIDLLSVSAHKLHGPKGTGFLYASSKIKLPTMIFGGGQQQGRRSGTENTPGIAAMGLAAKLAYESLEKDTEYICGLRDHLIKGLLQMEDVMINGPGSEGGAPHIVNASFLGIRSEVLLHSLEDRGIYVSAGSACSSHKKTGSDTLRAMGLSKERMESAIRFSFSRYNTMNELDETLNAISQLLPVLRRYTRR